MRFGISGAGLARSSDQVATSGCSASELCGSGGRVMLYLLRDNGVPGTDVKMMIAEIAILT